MSLRKIKQKLAIPIVAITLYSSSWNGNFLGNACLAEEWGRFRGANGTGIAGELHLDSGNHLIYSLINLAMTCWATTGKSSEVLGAGAK